MKNIATLNKRIVMVYFCYEKYNFGSESRQNLIQKNRPRLWTTSKAIFCQQALFQVCQMVYIFSIQKSQFGVNFGVSCDERLFHCHLVYFVFNLVHFPILVYFSRCPKKIWQPCHGPRINLKEKKIYLSRLRSVASKTFCIPAPNRQRDLNLAAKGWF
jgi:hypothetical protein